MQPFLNIQGFFLCSLDVTFKFTMWMHVIPGFTYGKAAILKKKFTFSSLSSSPSEFHKSHMWAPQGSNPGLFLPEAIVWGQGEVW